MTNSRFLNSFSHALSILAECSPNPSWSSSRHLTSAYSSSRPYYCSRRSDEDA
jgi:hypothetical protein